MKTKKTRKLLEERGLKEHEINFLLDLVKASQKRPVFVATVKNIGAHNMTATISICAVTKNYFRCMDFYFNEVCGYKWSRGKDGVIVRGCQLNRIYDLLDHLAAVMGLEGKIKENFCQYFTL